MRLFVALDIGDDVRARLAGLLAELSRAYRDVKWVKPESLHVTLKFLGEQKEEKAAYIDEKLGAIQPPGRLDLSFRGLGCFPNVRRPRVFWVGAEAPSTLAELAGRIDAAMEELGIEREKRPFSPHLTLGRARESGPTPRIGSNWQQHANDDFGATTANQFFLFQSKLSPAGSQYTRLRAYPLS